VLFAGSDVDPDLCGVLEGGMHAFFGGALGWSLHLCAMTRPQDMIGHSNGMEARVRRKKIRIRPQRHN